MADFVEKSNTKIAVRELPVPIADITTFNTLVSGRRVWQPLERFTAYEVAGVARDPV